MDFEYLKIAVTISLAVLGWIIAHWFTTRRDRALKRRELSIQYLIEAYRVLANEISHRDQTPDRTLKLENMLSDIQLFGSLKQVQLARTLADELASKRNFELDPLINSLRDDLRKELGLSRVEGNVRWIRFSED